MRGMNTEELEIVPMDGAYAGREIIWTIQRIQVCPLRRKLGMRSPDSRWT